MVLLAYPEAGGPVVITTHSRDDRATANLIQEANAPVEAGLAQAVMTALLDATLQVQAANVLRRNSLAVAQASA